MSPEKCLDRPVNRRSDVYSLGCVIYHCLTGSPPFMHRDLDKLKEMHAIDYALPPGRRSQRRVIPDEVDSLISQCLEKDPAKRIKNAGVLRANIGRVLQIDDQSDEPPPHSKKFADFSRRKRRVFLSVAALVVAMGALAWLNLNITSSTEFQKLIEKTIDRRRNKFFLQLEHGAQFVAQAEFENGTMIPDPKKDVIYIMVRGEDVILFATSKRKTMKEALEEAVRRRLILFRADLIRQDLKGCKITGGRIENCFLVECDLDGADLTGSFLKESIFAGSTMKGAKLGSVNAPLAVFQGCDLEGATFSGALLFDCDFTSANLKNVNFAHSKLVHSNFAGADLTGADFTGATISKYTLSTAKMTDAQKSKLEVIDGPQRKAQANQSPNNQSVKPAEAPMLPIDAIKNQNPFSQPADGNGAFGPIQQQQGLTIDLNNLPPAPPKKKRYLHEHTHDANDPDHEHEHEHEPKIAPQPDAKPTLK